MRTALLAVVNPETAAQELEAYDFTGTQVARLDVQLEPLLQLATAGRPALALPDQGLTGREKRQGDAPAFNVQQYLYQINGHLGAFFRRIRARSGTPTAITATVT